MTLISGNITWVRDKAKYLISLSVTVPPRGTLSAYIEMSSLSLSKQTKKETTRQASRRKSVPSLIFPVGSLHCRKSLDGWNVILHSASAVLLGISIFNDWNNWGFFSGCPRCTCHACHVKMQQVFFYIFIFDFLLVKVKVSR